MTVWPDFAPRFRCRAGACGHSCCRGWEIDVDEDSRRFYETVPGPLGKTLLASLVTDADGAHFALTGDGRCPLLRSDGLCELICQLGDGALCDICAEHPRFYLDFGDMELCGLGLSCEAVCALLLAEQGPLGFTVEETGKALTLSDLLRLGGCALERELVFVPRPEAESYARILDVFSRTEPIDEAWTAQLRELQSQLPRLAKARSKGDFAGVYSRILQYILYRQLDKLPKYGPEAVLAYAELCTEFVFLTDAWTGDTAEALRRWSEQIEYSTENVDLLLQSLTEN